MSQLEMRPRAHIHTFINTYIHTHENNSENRGRNLSGNDFNIETRAYLSQRSAARDVKYSARARRDAAEIENSRNAQNSRLYRLFIHLARNETQLPASFVSPLFTPVAWFLLAKSCHDISKGELPTPGMSDRVHFADFSCKHEALGAAWSRIGR